MQALPSFQLKPGIPSAVFGVRNPSSISEFKIVSWRPRNYFFVNTTGVPRPIANAFDAFPLFTAISKYPLDPIYATGSPAFPLANIVTIRVTG